MRTHCRKGHELTDENSYTEKTGYRRCAICRLAEESAWQKADYEKNPEKYKERNQKQEEKPSMKKYRSDFYQRTRNAIWRRFSVLRSAAKRARREFTLTQEEYRLLVEPNCCHYCGGPLPESCGAGLDRQNNQLGYIRRNVVPCCERCNERKGRLEGVGFRYPRTVELLTELIRNENPSVHCETRNHDG